MCPAEASQWGEVLEEVAPCDRAALLAWVRTGSYVAQGTGDLPSLPDFEDRYVGTWECFSDYAYELFEGCGFGQEMPEHLAPYFDHAAWTRDLAFDYTTEPASDGGVHIFRAL